MYFKTLFYNLIIFFLLLVFGCKNDTNNDQKDGLINNKNDNPKDSTIKEDIVDKRWELFYSNIDNDKYYYDTKTMKKKNDGEGFDVWILMISSKEMIFDYNNKEGDYSWCQGKKYKRIERYIYMDCKEKEVFLREELTFFIEGKSLRRGPYSRVAISPESSYEELYNKVCSQNKP